MATWLHSDADMGGAPKGPRERFGPFEVYEKLGCGGMAVVHRAVKLGIAGFTREVALKRLLPHLARDERVVAAFIREAKLAVRLRHPNIAHIYELGKVGDTYFITMEYVAGHNLRDVRRELARSQMHMPVEVVVSILLELCEALDYAHTRADDLTGEPLGIVHRDVSPSNLVLSDGHLKVIDFGIAKAAPQELATESGRLKGTYGYMAPEVLSGHPADARSDLFSAGVVAHEMLTGRRLFGRNQTYENLRRMHEAQVTAPSAINPTVPPEIDDVVMSVLARDPDERAPSADALWRELYRAALELELNGTSERTAAFLQALMIGSTEEVEHTEVQVDTIQLESGWETTDADSHPPV